MHSKGIKDNLFDAELPVDHAHIYISFDNLATVEEFYRFMDGPFLEFLYVWWGRELFATLLCPCTLPDSLQQNISYSPATFDGSTVRPGYLYGNNKIVGGIRIASLRLDERSCSNAPGWIMSGNLTCYGDVNNKGAWNVS